MGQHFVRLRNTQRPIGKPAKEARNLYHQFVLEAWEILRVRHVTTTVAHTNVQLRINSELYQADLR